jgi:peptide/nickel transport system ATP-binding protein
MTRGGSNTAAASDVLLDVTDLSVSLPTEHGPALGLDRVSFELEAGATIALVGESGCGKTMTCLALMGLLPPRASTFGAVQFDGVDLLALPESRLERIRGSEIAMAFQDPSTTLNPVLTIGFQIAETLVRHRGMTRTAAFAEARRLLDLVQMPAAAHRLQQCPHELSGGMCQRAMIAMAIACRPRILIADEPTTALDVTVQAQILALLKQIQRDFGMALILVTHDFGVVAQMAETAAVMYAGSIVERATVRELFDHPQHPYTQALLAALPYRTPQGGRLASIPGAVPPIASRPSGCAFRPRCAKAAPGCAVERPVARPSSATQWVACHEAELGDTIVSHGLGRKGRRAGSRPATPLVEAVSLTRNFDTGRGSFFGPKRYVHAVAGVDLAIAKGETLGLVGESGSGKSTIGRLLLCALPASGGQVRFDGEDVTHVGPARWRALRREMQLIQQNPGTALDPRMCIGDQLTEVLNIHDLGQEHDRRTTATHMLHRVGLTADVMQRFPHQLSGGQQQRIAIARALLVQPRFVVCDEPVSSLDLSVQAQVLNLLKDLQAELGLTYLFISHDLNVIRYVSDRIAVLYLGRIVEIGRREEVLGRPLHPYTRALLGSTPIPEPTALPPTPQLSGEPPDPAAPPAGCHFHTRCPLATEICQKQAPTLRHNGDKEHQVSCHHDAEEDQLVGACA